MKEFNRVNLNQIRDKIMKALDTIDLPIEFKVGRIQFSEHNFSAKLEAALIVDGEVKTQIATDFEKYAPMYGLKATDLGREYSQGGKKYRVLGLKTKNRKYPIIVESGGARYKVPAETVQLGLT